MDFRIEESWQRELADELAGEPFAELARFVKGEYARDTVYPPEELVFEAFNRTPFDRVKVVILGQDPYHNPDQAHGLCFSVRHGVPPPPSLVNIYKELEAEYPGQSFRTRDGDLTHWADQGVLLLNATLTVSGTAGAGSHQGRGWERFTDAAVRALAERRSGLVYLLWGAHAQKKAAFVDATQNLVLKSAHPSPLSARRGFFGCGHFVRCNDYLRATGAEPVAW